MENEREGELRILYARAVSLSTQEVNAIDKAEVILGTRNASISPLNSHQARPSWYICILIFARVAVLTTNFPVDNGI